MEQIKKMAVIISLCTICLSMMACGQKKQQQSTAVRQQTEQEGESEALMEQTEQKKDTNRTEDMADRENTDRSKDAEDSGDTDSKKQTGESDSRDTQVEKNGDYILARPSRNGALSVKGTQLVDESGQAVQLRGVSTHGIAWFPDYVNRDAVLQLGSDFGANLLRIAMYTDENGGYCTDGDKEKLKKLVEDGVAYAKEADMYVIVDWHILHDGNPLTHKTEALQFFREMTEKLKDQKHVLYEICNEPNGSVEWADVKAYAGEILPVIRENAPDAVVLIGAPTWSQEIDKPQNDPVTGYDNIMYTLHFYAATHKEDLQNKMVQAVRAGTPVFVSEFGLCDASGNGGNDLTQAQSWIDTMDQYGISYAVWSFCNKNETASLLASSCQKTSGFTEEDLSESGRWIYEMLRNKDRQNGKQDNAGQQKTNQNEVTQKTGDLRVDAKVTGSWESDGKSFYQYQLTITNAGKEPVSSWEIPLTFSEDITLSDGWNGIYETDGKKLTIRSMDYNGTLQAGASAADIGFIVSASGSLSLQQAE